ncbi:hypothetical protein EJ02DRAFT_360970 [Clathrospora elynae]|uniref:TPR-like protein n=1 Tax=Clathrospora elynae TaxID=706981 RepID=A0A6A5SE46_9PLEO|nr:hypothetical protein EJ02DRAFT_360970 [Clathrospora elynae]
MSSSYRLVTRPAKYLLRQPCVFCQSRQFITSINRNGASKLSNSLNGTANPPRAIAQRRNYAAQKLDVQRLRTDVDARARLGFYTLSKQQGTIKMEPHTADSIYKDFLAQKNKMDHGSNIQRLTTKYQLAMDDLTGLAMITFKIPDLSDPSKRAQLPPSQHKTSSGLLLQGCAQAEEPLAIVHILTAVYLSGSSSDAFAKDIARLFPQSEIDKYRKTLDMLVINPTSIGLGPDALTLKGLFLEKEGQKQKAKDLYQAAIQCSHLKFAPGSRHPMQLPLITPWNALGYLLKADKDPNLQAQAKKYFEKGALEADDPLSCYELAACEPKTSTKWLQYTSKAAASGHRQAIVNLTNFYQELAAKDSPILADSTMRKALNWLLGWRRGSVAAIAREWLQVASNIGHKPSMLQLADHYESAGDHERAKEHLRQMLEPPSAANQNEEWPQLVQLAKRRLAGIR